MENLGKYHEIEKQVTVKIRNAKRGMEKRLANSGQGNARQFANYIKSKTKSRVGIGPLKRRDGSLVTEDGRMADELNEFFTSVFSPVVQEAAPEAAYQTEARLASVHITEGIVRQKIKNLKENSAAGPDDICAKVLKNAAKELSAPLVHIFKASLSSGNIPRDWKTATVVPIHKKGPKGDPGNYRPISLTSIPGKLMESVLKDAILSHLVDNKQIKDSQHGFMPGRSCTTNLVIFMDKVTEAVDKGTPVDIFYLDFSKAFDKVPHNKLMVKLEQRGITGDVLKWICNWLSNRTQQVKVGQERSREGPVTSGVPQGSVLGPQLFTVYIDDVDDEAERIDMLMKFADDTKGMKEIRGPEDRDALQATLDKLWEWAERWGMSFNLDKCKIMHVGHGNPNYEYTMGGQKLKIVEEEKDVGITVHRSLKSTKHCQKAAGMANAVLTQLSRNFHYRDRNIFKKLYVQFVRPHVEFASPAWSQWSMADINLLEKVQSRAVNMVSGLKGETYEEKCRELQLDTLEQRRKNQDLAQAYKIMSGKDKVNPDLLFNKVPVRLGAATRGAADPANISSKRARLDVRKYSYSVRITDPWNRLDTDTKMAPSINHFKAALKTRFTN